MANGVGVLLGLQGKVSATSALKVTVTASTSDSGGVFSGGRGPITNLQGKVAAASALVVKAV